MTRNFKFRLSKYCLDSTELFWYFGNNFKVILIFFFLTFHGFIFMWKIMTLADITNGVLLNWKMFFLPFYHFFRYYILSYKRLLPGNDAWLTVISLRLDSIIFPSLSYESNKNVIWPFFSNRYVVINKRKKYLNNRKKQRWIRRQNFSPIRILRN